MRGIVCVCGLNISKSIFVVYVCVSDIYFRILNGWCRGAFMSSGYIISFRDQFEDIAQH